MDRTLEQLVEDLADGPQRPVYPYVVTSVIDRADGDLAQLGTSPNFQGGVITLCACKHHMRSGAQFRHLDGVWVAGITAAGVGGLGGRCLFYLMLVGTWADSQAEMWEGFTEDVREAKSASRHPLGDLLEPRRPGLAGKDRFDVENYRPPCADHDHADGDPPNWHSDIDTRYGKRRPVLLAGDPERSFLWSRPAIRLHESTTRSLPRTPTSSDTLADFLARLVGEGVAPGRLEQAGRDDPDLQRRVRERITERRRERGW